MLEPRQIDSLEAASAFVSLLSEPGQAYLYRALYLADMRIDHAERIIRDHEAEKKKAGQ